MAQGAIISKALTTSKSSRPPSLLRFSEPGLMVSLRNIKAMAQSLGPSHPLRVLLLGEPDEIPRQEYASKVIGWFRLIVTPVDSAQPGDR